MTIIGLMTMTRNISTKLMLIAGILTLILISIYLLIEDDASQVTPIVRQVPDQSQATSKDPFKEFLEKQQGTTAQAPSLTQPSQALPSQSQPTQPIQIMVGGSAKTITAGTDPFKAFLDEQAKEQKGSAVSPFTGGK